jgi:hypothetical protein
MVDKPQIGSAGIALLTVSELFQLTLMKERQRNVYKTQQLLYSRTCRTYPIIRLLAPEFGI